MITGKFLKTSGKRIIPVIITVFWCIAVIITSIPVDVLGRERFVADNLREIYLSMPGISENDYYKLLDQYTDEFYEGEVSTYPISQLAADRELKDGGILISKDRSIDLIIDVPEKGLYCLGFYYKIIDENILPAGISMKINGQYQFEELQRLVVKYLIMDNDSFPDRYGNEVMPMPKKSISGIIHICMVRITCSAGQ